jgi:two-component system, LytTR family, response regulator
VTTIVRALIVDDEPVARAALRDLLGDVAWAECVGEAVDGVEAVAAIRQLRPDLIFLDVQMPGMSGIEVLERAAADVAVIFTTAHDEYAMTAFELGAIDYLLKPFAKERFLRALERARPHVESRRVSAMPSVPLAERLALAASSNSPNKQPLSRLFVRDRGQVIPVPVADIVHCDADGDYVAIHAAGRRYLVYLNLSDLAARLDPERFIRIHRSHLVNLDRVSAMVPHDANRLEVRMDDGSRAVASRAGTQLLRARL